MFDGSFSGETLWENGAYVTPAAKRSMLKKLKAGKYEDRVQSKAAYEASRPTEPTYKVDETDEVFQSLEGEGTEDKESNQMKFRKKKNKVKKKKTVPAT